MKRVLDIPSLDPLREVLLLGQATLPDSTGPSSTPNQSPASPPYFGPAQRSDEGIVASAAAGTADPIGPISHANPILTAHVADSIDAQDRRLAVFDTAQFKAHVTRAGWGSPESHQYLTDIYHDSHPAQQGLAQADNWVHQAAAQGHAGAQWFLGFMLTNGIGIPKNDTEAFKWCQKAAGQGHAAGQANLGFLYLNGRGVAQSHEEAVKWFQKAAEQGHAVGQINLGGMYLIGHGVEQNYVESFQWNQMAAEQGHAVAQANLGTKYFYGRGVAQNDTEAFKWCQKAAGQGHAAGQAQLGWLYLNGRGVAQNDKEAFKWFQKAAGQGDAGAVLNLAKLYQHGKGAEKNNQLALYWLLKSGLSSNGKTIATKGDISVEVIQFLPELFAKTPEWQSVSTLKLAGLKLDDLAVASLAQLLAENPTLEVLDLRPIAKDDKEAAALALLPSKIGEKGVASLTRVLRDNVTLKELHLDGKAGSGPAWAEIAASLESNRNIAALTEAAEELPFQEASMDRIPADVIRLVEQATIVADQKAVKVSRTYKETQELVNEMRLAFAHQISTAPH